MPLVRNVALLVNPTAGRGRGARAAAETARRLRGAGVTVEVLSGRDVDEAGELARRAVRKEPDALVAVGGDGLTHTAVQALAGTDVPLAIVSCGTGNDIATALGVPLDPSAAAATVLGGVPRRIDLGRAGARWFAGVLCAGFDSAVTERTNQLRWPRGRMRYNLAVVLELGVFRPVPFLLELDGVERRLDAMLVAVGNTGQYGGGLRICPGAEPDDGLFEVVVVHPVPRRELVRVFPQLYSGRHVSHPQVSVHVAKTVALAAPDVPAYADGERVGALPVRAEVVPNALTVLTAP
ncbi:MAG: diacylglycerol/lipid kinase family protein [Streptosporangiales bacterium]